MFANGNAKTLITALFVQIAVYLWIQRFLTPEVQNWEKPKEIQIERNTTSSMHYIPPTVSRNITLRSQPVVIKLPQQMNLLAVKLYTPSENFTAGNIVSNISYAPIQSSNYQVGHKIEDLIEDSISFCEGNMILYGHHFVVLNNAVIYPPFDDTIYIKCEEKNISFTMFGHPTVPILFNLLLKLRRLETVPKGISTVSDTLFAAYRRDESNLYHNMLTWILIFIQETLLKLPKGLGVMIMDSLPVISDAWDAMFGSEKISRASNITVPTIFKKLVVVPLESQSPLGWYQPQLPIVNDFGKRVWEAIGLPKPRPANCSKLRVSIFLRHPYYAYNLKDNAVVFRDVKRKIRNEEAMKKAVELALPNHVVQSYDMATFSFKEQVKIAWNSDIVISPHGAQLTHTLFVPDHTVIWEIFQFNPKTHQVRNYRDFSRWRHLKYMSWNNADYRLGTDDLGTVVPPNIATVYAQQAERLLCSP